jgi:hypothetical protein
LATVKRSGNIPGMEWSRHTLCQLAQFNSAAADVFANGRSHARELAFASLFSVRLEQFLLSL